MPKTVKKILSFILVLTITIPLFNYSGQKEVQAASTYGSSWDVYIDSDNYLCITTSDKIRTSGIWYNTIGFTVSRCKYKPIATKELHSGAATEYKNFIIDKSKITTEQKNGVEGNTFRIPLSELLSGVGAEWYAEITNALNGTGPSCYIKFDSIMIIYDYGACLGRMLSDGTLDGEIYHNFPAECVQNLQPGQIQAARSWSDPRGLASHFNRYLLIGAGQDEATEKIKDCYIGTDKNEAEYKTGNWSDQFDLSTGIPSSEDVNNEYEASPWFGSTDVYARVVKNSKIFTPSYKVTWTLQTTTHNNETNSDDVTYTNAFKTVSVKVSSYIAYQYLARTAFYDLSYATVRNGSYESTLEYDSPDDTVMKMIGSKYYDELSPKALENDEEKLLKYEQDLINGTFWNRDGVNSDKKHTNLFDLSFSSGAEISLGTVTSTPTQAQIAAKVKELLKKDEERFSGQTKSWNDSLIVDGNTAITNKEIQGCNFYEECGYSSAVVINSTKITDSDDWKKCTESSAMKNPYKMGTIAKAARTNETGTQTTTIPDDTDNGKYSTFFDVIYERLIIDDRKAKQFKAGPSGLYGEDILSHLTAKGTGNEPINVHTPVIAPAVITDDKGDDVNEDTQILDISTRDNTTQLLLDKEYFVTWSPTNHRNIKGYGDSGDPSKYDKYTLTKEVKFPFDVIYNGQVRTAGTWITVKSPGTGDANESPDWTKDVGDTLSSSGKYQSENHWRMMPFYIPSWSQECGEKDSDVKIEYRVRAINTVGRYSGEHFREEYNANIEYFDGNGNPTRGSDSASNNQIGVQYIAYYTANVQLSGIMYDFTITGTSDKDQFGNMDIDEHNVSSDVHYPFCSYKEDKKVGIKNRFGEDDIRYRIDGTLENPWNEVNTVPLTAGKSNSYNKMGMLAKGSRFSFSIKTIANLWSTEEQKLGESGDWLQIKPSFRYVKPDGTQLDSDDIKVYYNSPVSDDLLIEYGKDEDLDAKNLQQVYLGHEEFVDSYYDEKYKADPDTDAMAYEYGDWVTNSVKYYNQTISDGNITNEEYLARKTDSFNLSNINLSSSLRFLSGEYEQLMWNRSKQGSNIVKYSDEDVLDAGKYSNANKEKFKLSMQTWQGQYYIPSELYIVDVSDDKDFDLAQYAVDKGGINYDDEIFLKKGYLVVNFDIIALNEGTPHLAYYGSNGGQNMWETEGGKKDPTPENPEPEDGDVVIIDLSKSTADKYKASLYNIN